MEDQMTIINDEMKEH